MKKLFLLCFLTLSFLSFSTFAEQNTEVLATCAYQLPYGPVIYRGNDFTTQLCNKAYITEYNNVMRNPTWIAYVLTKDHSMGCYPRLNDFHTDTRLVSKSVPQDYDRSGYDKGHIANAEDMAWNPTVLSESFLMSNMTPQLPNFNRGIWKNLETRIRIWASSTHPNIMIIAGPIYAAPDQKYNMIGKDNIIVPSHFYKVVIDIISGATLSFIFPHENNITGDLSNFLVPLSQVESYANIWIPVPVNVNKQITYQMWAAPQTSYSKTKKDFCTK